MSAVLLTGVHVAAISAAVQLLHLGAFTTTHQQ